MASNFCYQGNSGFFKGSVWTVEKCVQRALLDKQKLWGCQGWMEIQDNETSCLGVIFQSFCSRQTSLIITSSAFQQFSAPLLCRFLWVGTSQGTVCSGVVPATPPCWHGQQLVEALLRGWLYFPRFRSSWMVVPVAVAGDPIDKNLDFVDFLREVWQPGLQPTSESPFFSCCGPWTGCCPARSVSGREVCWRADQADPRDWLAADGILKYSRCRLSWVWSAVPYNLLKIFHLIQKSALLVGTVVVLGWVFCLFGCLVGWLAWFGLVLHRVSLCSPVSPETHSVD